MSCKKVAILISALAILAAVSHAAPAEPQEADLAVGSGPKENNAEAQDLKPAASGYWGGYGGHGYGGYGGYYGYPWGGLHYGYYPYGYGYGYGGYGQGLWGHWY